MQDIADMKAQRMIDSSKHTAKHLLRLISQKHRQSTQHAASAKSSSQGVQTQGATTPQVTSLPGKDTHESQFLCFECKDNASAVALFCKLGDAKVSSQQIDNVVIANKQEVEDALVRGVLQLEAEQQAISQFSEEELASAKEQPTLDELLEEISDPHELEEQALALEKAVREISL